MPRGPDARRPPEFRPASRSPSDEDAAPSGRAASTEPQPAPHHQPPQRPRPRPRARRPLPPRGPRAAAAGRAPTAGARPARRAAASAGASSPCSRCAASAARCGSINATFQPFHGARTGAVAVTIPPGADAGQIGEAARAAGRRSTTRALLRAQRDGHAAPRQAAPRQLHAAARDEQRRRDRRADAGPEGARSSRRSRSRSPRALAPRDGADGRQGRVHGRLPEGQRPTRARCAARARSAPRAARSTLEGFLFPATYELVAGRRARTTSSSEQLDAFEQNFGERRHAYAKRKNLTRYDVLIIASMVEREAQLDRERPLVAAVIYNRLKQGMPLGIDATIRYYDEQLDAAAARVRARARHAVQHAPATAACRRRRSATRASPRSRRPPTRRKAKYLFYVRKPGKTRRARVLHAPTRSSSATSRATRPRAAGL